MKKKLLSCIILLISTYVAGQDKFSPGFYLTHTKDTVKGFIQHRNNYNSQFIFRATKDDKSQRKVSNEVFAFGFFDGAKYTKLGNPLTEQKEPVFGEVLGQGEEINLVRYQGRLIVYNDPDKQFLLEKKGKNPDEVRRNYQKNVGVFNRIFLGCDSVKEKAAKISPNSTTLLSLLEDYHICKNSNFTNLTTYKNVVFKFGFFVGVSSPVSLNFRNSTSGKFSYLSRTKFSNSTSLMLGVINIFYSNVSPSISFQQEITYSRFSSAGSSYLNYFAGGYDITEISSTNFTHAEIGYKFGSRISIRSNKINPFIAAGFCANIPTGFKGGATITTQINSASETRNDFPALNSLNAGFWGSLGLSKRVSGHQTFIDVTTEKVLLQEAGNRLRLIARMGFVF